MLLLISLRNPCSTGAVSSRLRDWNENVFLPPLFNKESHKKETDTPWIGETQRNLILLGHDILEKSCSEAEGFQGLSGY